MQDLKKIFFFKAGFLIDPRLGSRGKAKGYFGGNFNMKCILGNNILLLNFFGIIMILWLRRRTSLFLGDTCRGTEG